MRDERLSKAAFGKRTRALGSAKRFPEMPLLTPAQNTFLMISQLFVLEMPGAKMHAQLRNRLVDLLLSAVKRAGCQWLCYAMILLY